MLRWEHVAHRRVMTMFDKTKRQRGKLAASLALPKWVNAGQVRRLSKALCNKSKAVNLDMMLLKFSKESIIDA